MATAPNVFVAFLARKLEASGSETTVYLDRITTKTGEEISTSDFATFSRGIVTINPDGDGESSFPEYCSFTAVDDSAVSLTGVTRGLSAKSNTEVAANKRFHPVGTPVVFSFGAHNIQDLIDYIDNEINTVSVGTANAVSANAGETISSAPAIVYLKDDGKWWLSEADTDSTVDNVQLGVALSAVAADAAITNGVVRKGLVSGFSGLTTGTTYYVSDTAGEISSSAGANAKRVGIAKSATELYFDPEYYELPSADEKAGLAGVNNPPSSTNQFVTSDDLSDPTIKPPQILTFSTVATAIGASDTQFDITNTSGDTHRYTYDGVGTDPGITSSNPATGEYVYIEGTNLNSANEGLFKVTGSDTNYFEVENANGVVENNVTIGSGSIVISDQEWTKDAGLKYIVVEQVGAGGGYDSDGGSPGGGAGGYARKIITSDNLSDTHGVIVGDAGANDSSSPTAGGVTTFGEFAISNGGNPSDNAVGGSGGSSTGGDINITGGKGGTVQDDGGTPIESAGYGGVSYFGGPGAPGAGGMGLVGSASDGIVIVTEYYS